MVFPLSRLDFGFLVVLPVLSGLDLDFLDSVLLARDRVSGYWISFGFSSLSGFGFGIVRFTSVWSFLGFVLGLS